MKAKLALFVVGAVCLWVSSAMALPPRDRTVVLAAQSPVELDDDKYLNANKLLGFVNNSGHLFYDVATTLGRNDGLYYPYTSLEDIASGANTKTVVFAAGLWMGGVVAGDTLVSVAEYSSEFTPGNMIGGTFDPGYMDSKYRVYKLYRDSMASHPNQDYLQWPADQGAPLDGGGLPLLSGDQTAWSVYNDANGSRHTNHAGSTLPLGIEVRQTAWASNDSTEQYQIYVKYQLFNRGGKTIDDFYLGFWSDPDLGGPADDLVGCDTLKDMFYMYNATNTDAKYDSTPPAWGGRIVAGPIVVSPGDSARFYGQTMHGYKNLNMTAFSKYVNGTDPSSYAHTYNYLRGLNRDGSPYIYNGNVLRYINSGDPIGLTGDVDAIPSDRRLMASCGPITFNPGDSQEVTLRFAAIQGADRLESLRLLKLLLSDSLRETECASLTTTIDDYGSIQRVEFAGLQKQWLSGVPWGAEFLNRSSTYGDEFWGSRLHHTADPDSFVNVQILFSPVVKQKAYRFVAPDYDYSGYEWVPFTVWDTDHQRKLNVAFVEYPNSRTFNQTWDVDDQEHLGGREYLFIFASSYPGDAAPPSSAYTTSNLKADASQLDILYGAWLMLNSFGASMSDLTHGDRLFFDIQKKNHNGVTNSIVFPATDLYWWSGQTVTIRCQTSQLGSFDFVSSDPVVFSVRPRVGIDSVVAGGRVDSIREMSNGLGPVIPPKDVVGVANSTGDWYLSGGGNNPFNHIDAHDWEIRFTLTGSVYYSRQTASLGAGRVPFELWDIGLDTPDDPADDRRMSIVVGDQDNSDSWTFDDRIHSYDLRYTETPGTELSLTWSDSCRIGRIIFQRAREFAPLPANGTTVRFYTYKRLPTVPPLSISVENDFIGSAKTEARVSPQDMIGKYDILFTPRPGRDSVGQLLLRDVVSGEYRGSIGLLGHVTGSCCAGTAGNVDCDPGDGCDISDLSALIDFLYISFTPLCCNKEANVDGDSQGGIDISDLSALIDYLYISFTLPAVCR